MPWQLGIPVLVNGFTVEIVELSKNLEGQVLFKVLATILLDVLDISL